VYIVLHACVQVAVRTIDLYHVISCFWEARVSLTSRCWLEKACRWWRRAWRRWLRARCSIWTVTPNCDYCLAGQALFSTAHPLVVIMDWEVKLSPLFTYSFSWSKAWSVYADGFSCRETWSSRDWCLTTRVSSTSELGFNTGATAHCIAQKLSARQSILIGMAQWNLTISYF